MALLHHDGKEKDSDDGSVQLATGSGDETVKVRLPRLIPLDGCKSCMVQLWDCTPDGPVLVHNFECWQGAVLALVAHNETIYAGCQDGHVKVLDLETKTLVRTIIVQEVHVLKCHLPFLIKYCIRASTSSQCR